MALGLCAVAGVLFVLPADIGDAIRTTVHDTARPGIAAVGAVGSTLVAARDQLFDRSELEFRVAELEAALAAAELRSRAAALQTTRSEAPPLVESDLLPARILGTEAAEAWRAGTLVDVGLGDGVREDTAVLAAEGPLVDRGRDADVLTGDTLIATSLAGRTLVGRLRVVGRWTSIVQPVTDADFRIRVQLAHDSERGLVLGPTGILRGTGEPVCRLDFVGSTESVLEGDDVYALLDRQRLDDLPGTDLDDPVDDENVERLYVGRVSRAELPSGAPHWEIDVTPSEPTRPGRVAILRRRLDPDRLPPHPAVR